MITPAQAAAPVRRGDPLRSFINLPWHDATEPLLTAGSFSPPAWQPMSPFFSAPLQALLGAETAWLELADDVGVRIVRVRYDTEFHATDFALAGLACPPTIERCVPKRRQDYLFGRLAARAALMHLPGHHAPAEIGIGEKREPLWPPGTVGSISHSGGIAVATAELTSARRCIGIDIEQEICPRQYLSFDQIVIDGAETKLITLHASDAWPLLALATAVFSAKEAFYKAVWPQVRRTLDFADLRLVAADPNAGLLGFEVATDLSPSLRHASLHQIRIVRLEGGFVLTCCVWSP